MCIVYHQDDLRSAAAWLSELISRLIQITSTSSRKSHEAV